ncbi:MAG: PGF-CTERM sorting domain-containing protein [Halobacteriota archaeon]|nr:PGF-CTERM sorting domain-containing protein [Halobacteriota archaeon]
MKGRSIIIAVVLLFYLISSITPALAGGYIDKYVICADKPAGYKDFTPHYQFKDENSIPQFPPGATVYLYLEATGVTKEDTKTGQFKPSIGFSMSGERLSTGSTFTGSASSDVRINDDKTSTKKTFAVISYKIESDAVEGKYRMQVTARDKNADDNVIGTTPNLYFEVRKDASQYLPYDYIFKDLTISPGPAELGQTVTISVNVTNNGGKGNLKGEDIVMNYGEDMNSTMTLHLADEEMRKVEFKLSKTELEEAGTYNVTIGDLNGTIVVNEPVQTTSDGSTGTGSDDGPVRRTPGFTSIYAAFGILAVAYLMNRRRV